MGHVARQLEADGIPTVIVAVEAFGARLAGMRVPRVLLTPFPMGRPFGPPHDAETQRAVMEAALALLASADAAGSVTVFGGAYRPG